MSCPLCNIGGDGDFPVMDLELSSDRFVRNPDDPEEDHHTDYVELTRAVRTEFSVNTTVSAVKRHLNEHIAFTGVDVARAGE